MPTVSVIMPMYNSVKYVKQAIDSILHQSFSDLELIVINDGSKDGCADVVRSINDDRLVFIDRENKGFLATLNECIDLAKGKYIARLDDDDWCYPERIGKEVEYLDTHPEVVLVGTLTYEQIDDRFEPEPETPVVTPSQIRYALLFDNYAFAHSSFMMRKDVLINNNIQYEMFKQVPDYHMITQLSRYGDIARIQERLVVYRIHSAQSTQVRSSRMKQDEIDNARAWFIDTLPFDERDRKSLKTGILRKIRTINEIEEFNKVLEKYKEMCEIGENDGKCVDFLYKTIMFTQFCTPKLLLACLKSSNKRWLMSKTGFLFAIKCITRHNPSYLETTVMI